jgi:hypothetical protein
VDFCRQIVPILLKGYGYYELGWLHRFSTDFGLFQVAYQGSPETAYLDVGYAFPGGFPVDVVGRGKWVNVTQDPTTGLITVGNPYTKRTPWYNQTDLNIQQNFKIGETKALSFSGTLTNLLNQRAVTSVVEQIDSNTSQSYVAPGGHTLFDGTAFYSAAFQAYALAPALNASPSNTVNGTNGPITINSGYGQPNWNQLGRTIRIALRFTF